MDEQQPEERLSSRILNMLKNEISKGETQKTLKCMIDPLTLYVLEVLQPYLIVIIVLLTTICMLQGYIIFRFVRI
jgi:hypothetical protein